ncbi:uncharacterized protein EI90DRAFT_3035987 [Cantharellus anzutake]|uniref:uncharacterized protein n=1 Tax=Cantharellus anzutake TaxID=1750568 RepID=UPI001908E1D4|nr:uncharacterized protein EI90DRAFT_3035987 [Cantharellus anzutake]KAF8340559.1 hypothetical protein EI90DRAFT_3035987 [Cantharellus anzutake]
MHAMHDPICARTYKEEKESRQRRSVGEEVGDKNRQQELKAEASGSEVTPRKVENRASVVAAAVGQRSKPGKSRRQVGSHSPREHKIPGDRGRRKGGHQVHTSTECICLRQCPLTHSG